MALRSEPFTPGRPTRVGHALHPVQLSTANIDAKFIEMPRRTKTQFCAAEALLFSIERFVFPIRES
jgi:hypothetical protein